jgi:hypothetical protein
MNFLGGSDLITSNLNQYVQSSEKEPNLKLSITKWQR